MLPRILAATAIGLFVAGTASARPLDVPSETAAPSVVLVKHDGRHDNGRHLGWYKRHGEDEDEDAQRGAGGGGVPPWARSGAGYYGMYGMPGYGGSYPPLYNYPPPYFYRGY